MWGLNENWLTPAPRKMIDILFDTCHYCIHGSFDWLYTCTETYDIYGLIVNNILLGNIFLDDSFNYLFDFYFFNSTMSQYAIFLANFMDFVSSSSFYKNFNETEWTNFVFATQDATLIYIYHPELFQFNNIKFFNYLSKYFSEIYVALYDEERSELFFSFMEFYVSSLVFGYIFLIILVFYLNYFHGFVKKLGIFDFNFSITSILFESEKELGSIDDSFGLYILFWYIFGWFFYTQILVFALQDGVQLFVLIALPILFYVIFYIPTTMLSSFGIKFMTYLRGSSTTSITFIELLYDCINGISYYIRLAVQTIRLLLIIFTITNFHEVVIYFNIGDPIGNSIDNFLLYIIDSIIDFPFSEFFWNLNLIKTIYFLYELFHTYFVVTAQITAFFSMVFWLFLFLYTCFIFEKIEDYFTDRRNKKEYEWRDKYLDKYRVEIMRKQKF